jgi:serine/threonine protein kinase
MPEGNGKQHLSQSSGFSTFDNFSLRMGGNG